MKTLKLIVLGMILFLANTMQAQISVGIRIGSPPAWGPAGYSNVRYYYLPDVEAYYDVPSSMFIYFDGRAWVRRGYLPDRYKNYDLYGGYKVVLTDYRGNSPYSHFKDHRSKYGRGFHREAQRTIGERPGRRNSGAKISQEEKHVNKESSHGNDKSVGHDNNKRDSQGNGKNKKEGGNRGNGKNK
jgi:hypothetical protein